MISFSDSLRRGCKRIFTEGVLWRWVAIELSYLENSDVLFVFVKSIVTSLEVEGTFVTTAIIFSARDCTVSIN